MNTRILLVTFLWMISITVLSILATKSTQNFKILMTIVSENVQKVFIVFVSRWCLMKIFNFEPRFIKRVSPIYFYWQIFSLANVINKSLKSGVFEQDWKNTRMMPIYEDNSDINDENNYRTISLIDHIAKMIESFVSYQIVDFLKSIVLFQWANLLIWK